MSWLTAAPGPFVPDPGCDSDDGTLQDTRRNHCESHGESTCTNGGGWVHIRRRGPPEEPSPHLQEVQANLRYE